MSAPAVTRKPFKQTKAIAPLVPNLPNRGEDEAHLAQFKAARAKE